MIEREKLKSGVLTKKKKSDKRNAAASVDVVDQSLSCIQLFATPWIVAWQAPLDMGFRRQEHWSGLSFFSSGSS